MNLENPSIDILLPVYNEAENIEKNLDFLTANLKNIKNRINIYIIYDFEEDNTLPVIEKIKNKYKQNVRLLKNKKKGVLNAIKLGFLSRNGDYKLLTMSDMSDDYEILPLMIQKANEGYDVICASRYMKGGKLYGGPLIKQFLSRLAGVSLYYITKIPTHDITNSFRLYKSDIFKNIQIESTGGFEINMEITIKAYLKHYRIIEIPARWWDRKEGQSKFKFFQLLPQYLKWYFYLLQKLYNFKERQKD